MTYVNYNYLIFVEFIADLLLDVHNLGKYIKQGDATTAARIASQLASKGVHLQAKSSRNTENEKEFTYV
jgi:hypothetical protein